MKTIRFIIFAAALLTPQALAQGNGGVETIFDSTLAALCDSQGAMTSVPLGDLSFDIPGLSEFGLDLRPLCQYADIVGKSTKSLKGLRDGAFGITEEFINDALAGIANTIGSRVGTEKANEMIEELDGQLRSALEGDEAFLSAYREATQQTVEQLREAAIEKARDDYDAARGALDGDSDEAPSRQVALDGFVPRAVLLPTVIDGYGAAAEQGLEAEALNHAATELLQQQLENNAHQQTIEDTLRQGGVAQSVVQDAQRATSVRQSINVLTEAIAGQLKNDAVFSGALIENLQANARQQAITNHQLGILAAATIAEQERALQEAEAEANQNILQATEEMSSSLRQLNKAIEDVDYVTSPEPMKEIEFSYCGLFGNC